MLKKAIIPILAVLCVISTVVMVIAVRKTPENNVKFVPPDFSAEAVEGIPTPPDNLGWSELYRDGMSYKLGICGNLVVTQNSADVYFFNSESNTVWLKLRILNENNKIIGETDLIKPNQYIKSVKFNTELYNNQKIKLKIMAYQPETYYSEGAVVLNTTVKVEA